MQVSKLVRLDAKFYFITSEREVSTSNDAIIRGSPTHATIRGAIFYCVPHSTLNIPVAPVAYQVIHEHGIGQFREFEPRRVHTRVNSLGLFLVHKLTCGKRESVS